MRFTCIDVKYKRIFLGIFSSQLYPCSLQSLLFSFFTRRQEALQDFSIKIGRLQEKTQIKFIYRYFLDQLSQEISLVCLSPRGHLARFIPLLAQSCTCLVDSMCSPNSLQRLCQPSLVESMYSFDFVQPPLLTQFG